MQLPHSESNELKARSKNLFLLLLLSTSSYWQKKAKRFTSAFLPTRRGLFYGLRQYILTESGKNNRTFLRQEGDDRAHY